MEGGCYYLGYRGWAFGWTQMVPWVVTIVCTVLTMATHQPIYFIFSTFLYIPQITLWAFQAYFQMSMPDPICQVYHAWAFPSIPAFYVGICVVTFFAICYLWQIDHSWIVWLTLIAIAFGPPLTLIWFSYNRWWEVLFSFGFGAVIGLGFAYLMYYYVTPVMPYLQHHFPLYHFGYIDTICMNDKQKRAAMRIHEILLKYSSAPAARLY